MVYQRLCAGCAAYGNIPDISEGRHLRLRNLDLNLVTDPRPRIAPIARMKATELLSAHCLDCLFAGAHAWLDLIGAAV